MASPAETSDAVLPAKQRQRDIRALFWAVSIAWLAVLTWMVAGDLSRIASHALVLGAWALLLLVVNLLPISGWQSVHFTADLPIIVAAALVLSPGETALVATLGAFETRELRRETSLPKALYDRSQIGLASFLASLATHAVSEAPSESLLIVPLAFVALSVDSIVNYASVAAAVSLERGYPFHRVIRSMKLGTLKDFTLTLLAWGVLGAMLASLYAHIGPWALFAFLAPTMLGRQVLLRSQMYIDKDKAYRSREIALAELAKHVDQERTDERRLIAADLHDEVLQPLFKVSLMAHVLKTDLAKGRLLELEEDLPDLAAAADEASDRLRDLIGDLRRSPLGRAGLGPTLSKLVKRVSSETTIRLHSAIGNVETDSVRQLALYHIAKEALANVVQHSVAKNAWIELEQQSDWLRVTVRDDGVGFDPDLGRDGHYGIQIMRERAAALGGNLFLDTAPTEGCSITCLIPSEHRPT